MPNLLDVLTIDDDPGDHLSSLGVLATNRS